MPRSFPPQVAVLGTDSLTFARFEPTRGNPRLVSSKTYPLPASTWEPGVVTPVLRDPEALTSLADRLRRENGRFERLSLLLPDTWFRINILDVASLPERRGEAEEMVRWNLKRTLPIRPEDLRMSWLQAGSSDGGHRVFVVAALDRTLTAIEESFRAAGIEIVLIESTGLNLWNSVIVREHPAATGDRILVYLRGDDFTAAVFRGATPLFVRSRAMTGERALMQEIRLSASYVKANVRSESLERCYVAGSSIDAALVQEVGEEFGAPSSRITLSDVAEVPESVAAGADAELAACTGVFAA